VLAHTIPAIKQNIISGGVGMCIIEKVNAEKIIAIFV